VKQAARSSHILFQGTREWVLPLYSPLRAPTPRFPDTVRAPELSPKDIMNILKSAITLVPVVALTGVVVVGIAVSVSLASWELL
jgi:hypothetical protein